MGMQGRISTRTILCVTCLGQLVVGCGVWQDTPDSVSFALPSELKFQVSSSSQWQSALPSGVTGRVCAGPNAIVSDCCTPPSSAPSFSCQTTPVACDPATNLCALTFDVVTSQDVSLVQDSSAIAGAQGRIFSRVWLGSLTFTIEDLASLPIRSAGLYIGPSDTAVPGSSGTVLLASIPLSASRTTLVPDGAGQEAFSAYARNYQTPFSLMVSAHLVASDDVAPNGTVNIKVSGQGTAYY